MVKPDGMRAIRVFKNARLQSATNHKGEVVSTIKLHVRMEETGLRILFRIAKKSAFSGLLGTLFTVRFARGMLPAARRIVS